MTYRYLCGTCGQDEHLTMPEITAHWRAHRALFIPAQRSPSE